MCKRYFVGFSTFGSNVYVCNFKIILHQFCKEKKNYYYFLKISNLNTSCTFFFLGTIRDKNQKKKKKHTDYTQMFMGLVLSFIKEI